jgi:hypothetical protein
MIATLATSQFFFKNYNFIYKKNNGGRGSQGVVPNGIPTRYLLMCACGVNNGK